EKLRSEDKNEEGSERMNIDTSNQQIVDTSDKNKGKAVMDSEPPAYVLKMQADIESQRIKQEALEQKVDKIAENQQDMSSKLDVILALMSKKT
ncbi:hypothetical protein A2U01_0035541, partial [Trifolium medium]|nr:hypothetical protein [Trifolium medium]